MIRLVVDTNVLISACIGRGAASRVIEACLEDRVVPYISGPLLLEYRDVIGRDEIFRAARLNANERMFLLDVFVSKCRLSILHFKWRPNLVDEGDNHLVELAIAANAHIIVTSNIRDFSRSELKFPHLVVETPERFMERLQQ
ncbi:putative toxin-antitoxin system toxin component, PIN family [Rhizobium sp. WYJ-E13]|nr:putative toxin-antitoxin system toxin component, PIN family [Rhizobium sp. WYJ-E13]